MKKIPIAQINEVKNAIHGMNVYNETIDLLVEEITDKMAELNEAIHKYNNMLKNVAGVREGVTESMKEFMEEQTDEWRSGKEGEKYTEWLDSWDELDLDQLPLVDDIEVDAREHASILEGLPMEVE